mmetsp:Transcript_23003/g.57649  ORF Transcript_23003/g.57649 Transcript_23003/m.57649 type:complete len:259 (-) Transcript_23003:112-888(-)
MSQLQHRVEARFHELPPGILIFRIGKGNVVLHWCTKKEKAEIALVRREVAFIHKLHAKILIEGNRLGRVFDPQHSLGIVELPRRFVKLLVALDDLDPVSIRVVGEGQPLHSSLVGPLLELHPACLQLLARLVHVGTHHCDVTETPLRLVISRVITFKIGVCLRSIVVCQLERGALVLPKEFVGFRSTGLSWDTDTIRQVSQEVDTELPLREVQGVDVVKSKQILVKRQGCLWVFDPEHRLMPGGVERCDRHLKFGLKR